jgi:hypothetical protein
MLVVGSPMRTTTSNETASTHYDCEGGNGNGPHYTGRVTVVGTSDPFDLDRNGDGIGCENSRSGG